MSAAANAPREPAGRDESSKIVEFRDQQRELQPSSALQQPAAEAPSGPQSQPQPPAPSAPQGRDEKQTATARRPARRSAAGARRVKAFFRLALMFGGIAAVVVAVAVMWLRGGRYVSTDNSYVRAAKLMVSTDVSGIVASVEVKQGQQVETGQVLFRLDPRQFEIAVSAAEAQLAQTRLTIEAARMDYRRIQSDIAAEQAIVGQAKAAFARAESLAKRSAGSQAVYDQTRFALVAEESKLASLQQSARVALERLGGSIDAPLETIPQYRQAQAAVAEAKRQLGRTVVRAPFAGTVTSVESLQPGTFLVAATAALTNTGAVGLISNSQIWVEANLKETDLTHVRPGNPVEVVVDTYPNRFWKGRVDSIFPSTSAEFSILPAQNAGGNWVKVVQRVPVRIALDIGPGDPPLRAGMSSVATVDTGHRRTLRDLWALIGVANPPVDLEPFEKYIVAPATAAQ